MNGKITLITPPDVYENSTKSVLFVNLSDEDQDVVSKWLSTQNLKEDINIYVYSGETDVEWFFWAIGVCQHKYIDLDGVNEITKALSGYVLGKSGFCYKTTDENLAAVYSHINANRITNITNFLERSLSEQNNI
jgi:hypothetical protein